MAKDKKEKKEIQEKSSGKLKTILIVVIALVVLGAGTFGGVFFYMKSKDSADKVITEVKVPVGDEITVNLKDTSSKRYLKVKVNISYDKKDKDAAKEVEEKLAAFFN